MNYQTTIRLFTWPFLQDPAGLLQRLAIVLILVQFPILLVLYFLQPGFFGYPFG